MVLEMTDEVRRTGMKISTLRVSIVLVGDLPTPTLRSGLLHGGASRLMLRTLTRTLSQMEEGMPGRYRSRY